MHTLNVQAFVRECVPYMLVQLNTANIYSSHWKGQKGLGLVIPCLILLSALNNTSLYNTHTHTHVHDVHT